MGSNKRIISLWVLPLLLQVSKRNWTTLPWRVTLHPEVPGGNSIRNNPKSFFSGYALMLLYFFNHLIPCGKGWHLFVCHRWRIPRCKAGLAYGDQQNETWTSSSCPLEGKGQILLVFDPGLCCCRVGAFPESLELTPGFLSASMLPNLAASLAVCASGKKERNQREICFFKWPK